MIVIGLTGGIASGKSTISNIFRGMGIPVIDCDDIGHRVVEKGSHVLDELVNAFGADILNNDGTLNRKKLGSIIFNDRGNLNKINSITHPAIKHEILSEIGFYKSLGSKCCIVDGALLMEGIFNDIVDRLILVYVNKEAQINRLMNRNSLEYEEALKRINSQMPYEQKKKYADYIIDNSYDLEYTTNQINKIMSEILKTEDLND